MIINFLKEHFFYLHPGYTTFNTIVFGVVLGLIILGIIQVFNKLNKNPLELTFPLIPIIVFGSTSRALVDNHVYPRIYLLATPGIYIFIGLITIFLLFISIYIEKHFSIKYSKVISFVGIIICIPNIILMLNHGINFSILILELLCWITISSPFIAFRNKFSLLKNYNLEVLLAHIFDATSTFVAMDFFGYYEQHVLPTLLINFSGTAFVMYPLKIVLILLALYIIDKMIDDETSKNMLKLSIFILGLAPGIRNFTTLILAMC